MQSFRQLWGSLGADESGQDTIEYALGIAVLALGAIASLRFLSSSMANFWPQLINKFYAAFG